MQDTNWNANISVHLAITVNVFSYIIYCITETDDTKIKKDQLFYDKKWQIGIQFTNQLLSNGFYSFQAIQNHNFIFFVINIEYMQIRLYW